MASSIPYCILAWRPACSVFVHHIRASPPLAMTTTRQQALPEMGTGNAHHYHINGSVFKVLIGPLFEKFSANYEIYGLYGMPLNEVTVYRNAHAVYKYVEVV